MCRVKSFLGCIKLETFGLFIGQLELVLAVAVAIPSILGIVVAVFAASFFGFSVKDITFMIVILMVVLIVCTFVASMSSELIEGVKARESEGVKIYRNLCIFNVLLAIALLICCLIKFGKSAVQEDELQHVEVLNASFINLLLQVYVLVCIHSLCEKFVDEEYPRLITPQVEHDIWRVT